jgi:hypothetical protein
MFFTWIVAKLYISGMKYDTAYRCYFYSHNMMAGLWYWVANLYKCMQLDGF